MANENTRERTPAPPAVAVVVVNWNSYEDTAECLAGLKSLPYPNYRVVVVDNGSTDGSGERLEREFDYCEFVFTDRNLGFGGGCNAGIELALSEGCAFAFLLNNDAELEPGALGELVDVAAESGADVVGAMVRDAAGDPVTSGRNTYPDMLFYSGYRENLPVGPGSRDDLAGRRFWSTDRVEGAGVLLSRELLRDRRETVGHYLDDSLFMYCEEVELALWCRRHRRESVIAANATVVHDGGNSSSRAFQLYYLTRNRILIGARYLSGPALALFLFSYLSTRLLLVGRFLGRQDRRVATAILRGLRDGFRGVDGRGTVPY